jgi:hypothetical protein
VSDRTVSYDDAVKRESGRPAEKSDDGADDKD